MYFEKLTAEEINSLPRNLPCILPVAAIEQHGAHLPVSTDKLINETLCSALEKQNSDAQLILPTIAVSCSGHHLSFGGTLTVSHRTFMSYVEEVVDSLIGQNFLNLIILNSHGGNIAASKCICESIALRNKKVNIMGVTWWNLITDLLVEFCDDQTVNSGHACQMETSILMHSFPDQVRTEKIQDGEYLPIPEWAKGDMLSSPKVTLIRTMRQMTKNGVQGVPSKANAEIGKRIVETFSDTMQSILKELKQLPPRI